MEYALKVENLGKLYAINGGGRPASGSIREQMGRAIERAFRRGSVKPALLPDEQDAAQGSARQKDFWALRDVSFNVAAGERIGIIGANGAGKSTLLKILSRVTSPTEGRVEIRGKVASLLEVGTGFHPELTGRENIFLNGAILGMPKSEIRRKFDQIVDFSGVEKFIDTPVKHYSSGMYVRLAFSVSAWLDPDILILDEVLAVGDQSFQKKCEIRMKELTKEGRTVLFVSHSMSTVNQMCQKVLYLEKGSVVSFSEVQDGTVEYQRNVMGEVEKTDAPWHRASIRMPDDRIQLYSERNGEVEFLAASVETDDGAVLERIPIDRPFSIRYRYRVLRDLPFAVVPNLHLYDEFGARMCVSMPAELPSSKAGEYAISCRIPAYMLNTGRVIAMPAVSSFTQSPQVHFAAEEALRLEIFEDELVDPRRHGFKLALPGPFRPRLDWSFDSAVR